MRKIILLLTLIFSVSACADMRSVEAVEPAYSSDNERFLDNVRIKQYDEYGITYEYKDVRIDEIAYMASEYCYEQKERKAVLHDSQLYKNFSRRATFHCL